MINNVVCKTKSANNLSIGNTREAIIIFQAHMRHELTILLKIYLERQTIM